MAKPKTASPPRTPLLSQGSAPVPQKPATPGKAVKVPDDVYEDLLRLQGVYPGHSIQDIVGIKLREALEKDRKLLEQLRALQRAAPPKE